MAIAMMNTTGKSHLSQFWNPSWRSAAVASLAYTPIDVTPIVNPAWPSVSSHPPAQAPFALVEANNFFYADMRRRRMTPRYSTCWEELPVAVLKYTYNSI